MAENNIIKTCEKIDSLKSDLFNKDFLIKLKFNIGNAGFEPTSLTNLRIGKKFKDDQS